MTLTDAELVSRYRTSYSLPSSTVITAEMVNRHWELERVLTDRLLASRPDDRRAVFVDCYTTLYENLPWLNQLEDSRSPAERDEHLASWLDVIGSPPQRVYEIGSGRGELIGRLAQEGHICTAAEITEERGARHLDEISGPIQWHATDGVHLATFERADTYDVVISNQLLEHLHPEDLAEHVAGVRAILKPAGRYILSTPHRLTGPHDVSRVFDLPEPRGMHLHEYTYRELFGALKAQCFRATYHAGQMRRFGWAPARIRPVLRPMLNAMLLAGERLLSLAPRSRRTGAAAILRRAGLFSENIFLVAVK